DHAEGQLAARERVDLPGDGRPRHLGAGERHEVADPEQAEVAGSEGRQGALLCHGCVGLVQYLLRGGIIADVAARACAAGVSRTQARAYAAGVSWRCPKAVPPTRCVELAAGLPPPAPPARVVLPPEPPKADGRL